MANEYKTVRFPFSRGLAILPLGIILSVVLGLKMISLDIKQSREKIEGKNFKKIAPFSWVVENDRLSED